MKQLTPRQGTKTRRCRCLTFRPSETTYTPSGDENSYRCMFRMSIPAKQLTPRQGTKTDRLLPLYTWSTGNNLHPARGRKLIDKTGDNSIEQKQLTPRQGTKTGLRLNGAYVPYETTYTPSGDENALLVSAKPISWAGNNLRPVRGRKPLAYAAIVGASRETTYAPTGDENASFGTWYKFSSGNNLHPVRGRKPHMLLLSQHPMPETTYAPPGDENILSNL